MGWGALALPRFPDLGGPRRAATGRPYGLFSGTLRRGGYHPPAFPVPAWRGWGDGLPRQCAHWLAMTGPFHQALREAGLR